MMWNIDRDPPPEPYNFQEAPIPQILHRIPHILLMQRPPDPPVKQMTLFPTLEEKVYDRLGHYLARYKHKITRLKHISKEYDVDLPAARKAYEAAFDRLSQKATYEHYQRNREYIQWFHSPEGRQYFKNFKDWCDARLARNQAEFERRLADGVEHVVAIKCFDYDLRPVLDNPVWADMDGSGPITFMINRTGLTENDARILWVREYMTLRLGREETLFDHKFTTREELERRRQERNENRVKCHRCDRELSYNDVGFAAKMGQPGLCPGCIGADPEFVESVTQRYRSSGCQMFI